MSLSYMLFAGWEVLIVNVTEVLKMLPEAAGRGQHFPKPVNNISVFFFLQ